MTDIKIRYQNPLPDQRRYSASPGHPEWLLDGSVAVRRFLSTDA